VSFKPKRGTGITLVTVRLVTVASGSTVLNARSEIVANRTWPTMASLRLKIVTRFVIDDTSIPAGKQ
jgi:hypothetical protein